MILILLAGFTFDIFGRRITIFLCFFLGALVTIFTPYTSPYVYPWLLIVKLLFTMMTQPLYSNPLVNDYIETSSRGRGLSVQHLGMNTGHLFSVGVLYRFSPKEEPRISFLVAGIYGIVASIVCMFFITEPRKQKENSLLHENK